MAIRAARIVFVSTALVAATLLLLWWNAREQPVPIDPKDAPWIGLPKSGMDATQPQIRQVIRVGFIGEGWSNQDDSLAFQCGNESGISQVRERYVAYVGRNPWSPSWKAIFDVSGQHVDVSLSTSQLFMPPPPPAGDGQSASRRYLVPVIHLSRTRAQLEPIRAAWSETILWDDPQNEWFNRCGDGNPVFLQACIDGRYAARFRNCDAPSSRASSKLWQAFNELLPPPPKPEWRDAAGNLIPDDRVN